LRADAYLSAVARNLLRSTYKARARDRQRMIELDDDVEVPIESGAEMNTEYEDLARAVHGAALSMDQPALRDVALGLLNGDSRAEVAERLAISPITVRTRLMRVRSLLRQRLPAYFEEQPIAR
jgi:DNA-directed RNA polymerase specialized sigma24 family protein